jgi:hypothetical protein
MALVSARPRDTGIDGTFCPDKFKLRHYPPVSLGTNRVRSPLDLLNKIISAVITYGPKNKTKKARKARKARKAALRKKMAATKRD